MPLTPVTQADSELERLLAKSPDSALHLFGDSSHGRLRLGVRPQLALHAHPQRSSGAAGPICTAGHFLPTEGLNPPVFGSTSSTRWPVRASNPVASVIRFALIYQLRPRHHRPTRRHVAARAIPPQRLC